MSQPNFLIIQADQLTAKVLDAGGNGMAVTPHLDALAENALVFENAYCNFPLCAPSRMAMLTGRLASRVGVYDNAGVLNSEIPTYAHYLRNAGYQTWLSGKMHFVGPDQLHGFEQRLTTDIYPADFTWTENRASRDDKHKSDARGVTRAGYCTRSVQLDHDELAMFHARQTLYDLSRPNRGRPWLLHVSLTHPHDPYYCQKAQWDRYEATDISPPQVPRLAVNDQDPLSRFINERHGLDVDFDEDQVRIARRGYLGSVSYFDDQVGLLMAQLKELGLVDNTVVVITSDHGDMLGERGMWFKRHHFEWSTRVPLIIHAPGRLSHALRSAPVSLVDLLPTLLSLAEQDPNDELIEPIDGRSLIESTDNHIVLGETMSDGLEAPVFMVRSGDHKLIAGPGYPTMLFDLRSDPDEQNNLAAKQTDIVNGLMAEVEANWEPGALQAKVERSINRRLLIRASHDQGKAPMWDHLPAGEDNTRWCRSWSDYNAWCFDVSGAGPR